MRFGAALSHAVPLFVHKINWQLRIYATLLCFFNEPLNVRRRPINDVIVALVPKLIFAIVSKAVIIFQTNVVAVETVDPFKITNVAFETVDPFGRVKIVEKIIVLSLVAV